MAQAEVVTVRMSRGNLDTPWGFEVVPPLTINNVVGGSLADRAGLLSGDSLIELEGQDSLDLGLARQLLSKAQHKVELVVHRTGSEVHRIWKPSITENTEFNRFQHSVHNVAQQDGGASSIKPAPPLSQPPSVMPVKVSLQHQNQDETNVPGFNVAAQPFGSSQEVKHLQYNSPMVLYSPQNAAEQYLQQTGGLFGTDPNVAKMKEQPSYLRSETLRLIQESEHGATPAPTRPVQPPQAVHEDVRPAPPSNSGLPQCFLCGRNILGVLCKAFDHTMHAECFQCATCGAGLKNQGHHFLNDKFYCDVHGRQLKGREAFNYQAASTQLHPAGGGVPKATSAGARRTPEGTHAFYQPDIMARRPLSISPTPWKTQSPISPNNRGVPSAGAHYGQDLKSEAYSSSTITHQSNDPLDERSVYAIPHQGPGHIQALPAQIRHATSQRRLPPIKQWPPPSQLIGNKFNKFWQFDHHLTTTPPQNTTVSLTSYINELDLETHRVPSPKRDLMRGEPARQQASHLSSKASQQASSFISSQAFAGHPERASPAYKQSNQALINHADKIIHADNHHTDVKTSHQSLLSPISPLFGACPVSNLSPTLSLSPSDQPHEYAQPLPVLNAANTDKQSENISAETPVPAARRTLQEPKLLSSTVLESQQRPSNHTDTDTCCIQSMTNFPQPQLDVNLEAVMIPSEPDGQTHRRTLSDSSSLTNLVDQLRKLGEQSPQKTESPLHKKDLTPQGLGLGLGTSMQRINIDDMMWPPPFDAHTTDMIRKSLALCQQDFGRDEDVCEDSNLKETGSMESIPSIQDAETGSIKSIAETEISLVQVDTPYKYPDEQPQPVCLDFLAEIEGNLIPNPTQFVEEDMNPTVVLPYADARPRHETSISSDNPQAIPTSPSVVSTHLSRTMLTPERYEEADARVLDGEADARVLDGEADARVLDGEADARVLDEEADEEVVDNPKPKSKPKPRRDHDLAQIDLFRQENIERLHEISHAVWHEPKPPAPNLTLSPPCKCTQTSNGSTQTIESSQDSQRSPSTLEEIRRLTCEIIGENTGCRERDKEKLRLRDEKDKKIAIQSIERHQRHLQHQQEQLSQLLDNAVCFLKNLDLDALRQRSSPESSLYDGVDVEVDEASSAQQQDDGHNIEQYDNIPPSDIQISKDEASDEACGEATNIQSSHLWETPSERIVRTIHQLNDGAGSSNKFAKTTTATQQTIRQGDDSARGRGTLQAQGGRVPFCEFCKQQIRGAYVLATGLAWCPEHFVCANKACNRRLLDIGFVEDNGLKYCEQCFENLIAPHCAKCNQPITADCLNALQKQWHPHCFVCAHCRKPFGNSAFFLEQGMPYCETDWNALFTTKCISCHYPIEAGDRWVEALGSAFHSNCFNCTSCNVNLEGESFYAKNGAPYCKLHA